MRVGVLSDIHANKVALDAVLADMPAVDRVVCAGDVVGYNPWPAECVDYVRGEGVPTVMGNHDRMVARDRNFGANGMAQAGVAHAKRELSSGQIEWLRTLHRDRTLSDGRLKLVHDHPTRRDHYTYPGEFSPDLLGDEDVLVLGHTHVQHHETFDDGIVLNPGSVGQPRDRDNRAAYAVIDLDDMTVDERRVDYDVDRVRDAIRDADLPRKTGARLEDGR